MSIGMYRGIRYKQCRIDDVLCVEAGRARWWFVCYSDGAPSANHYRTLRQLRAAIDDGQYEDFRQ